MTTRNAYYAGLWYSRNKESLKEELDKNFSNEIFGPEEFPKCLNKDNRTIIGGVSPHAGYGYSGPCAAYTYLNLFKEKIPDTIIILGNHHHFYRNIGLMKEGEWETPLGNLSIDDQLAETILDKSTTIIEDSSGFIDFDEHNIEIQLPFIKYLAGEKDVKIVPIKVMRDINFNMLDKLSDDIVSAINSVEKDIIIVASSDMSHYDIYNEEQLKILREIDQTVIEQFLALKSENILNPENVIEQAIFDKFRSDQRSPSVCGRQTIATLVSICKKLHATNAKLLKYYISKDIKPGPGTWTVGYFSGILTK